MSYKAAKAVLTVTERERIMAIYFNCTPTNINWEGARTEFGSATAASFRVMHSAAMCKVKKAKADAEAEGGVAGPAAVETSAKAVGKKRKAVEDDDEAGTSLQFKPKKRARGKKAKTEELTADADVKIKPESFDGE